MNKIQKIVAFGFACILQSGDFYASGHNITASGNAVVTIMDSSSQDISDHPLGITDQYAKDVYSKFLTIGDDVNKTDNGGDTLLHLAAAKRSCADIVPLLLARGININHRNIYGQSALDIADYMRSRSIAKILRDAGAHETPAEKNSY